MSESLTSPTGTVMIEIQAINAFNDNYIWCLIDRQQATAIVVDPGDASPVIDFLEQHQLHLSAVLITHHHADHTGGLGQLQSQFSMPVYGPNNPAIKGIQHKVDDGDKLELLATKFDCIATPGHTLDHISYYSAELQALFCGDTLFGGGCGRLFEGTAATMLASLDKLCRLPDQTGIYCAHEYTLANLNFAEQVEPNNDLLQQRIRLNRQQREQGLPTLPSLLSDEKATNPFLRCRQATVITSATAHGCPEDNDTPSVFATIRRWKDQF